MKITEYEIANIKTARMFFGKLKVHRIAGTDLFAVFGFHYGVEQLKARGNDAAIAMFLNSYFGISDSTTSFVCRGFVIKKMESCWGSEDYFVYSIHGQQMSEGYDTRSDAEQHIELLLEGLQ